MSFGTLLVSSGTREPLKRPPFPVRKHGSAIGSGGAEHQVLSYLGTLPLVRPRLQPRVCQAGRSWEGPVQQLRALRRDPALGVPCSVVAILKILVILLMDLHVIGKI